MPKTRFYFDYAASAPVAPEVERAMLPYFSKKFGNAGSLHSFGQEAVAALDSARETVAKAINANFREVIFTGSATESNNIALRGLAQTVRGITRKKFNVSQREVSEGQRLRIIVSAIEHESVLETARDLENEGVEVVYLPVDRNGIVNLEKLKSALNERTILVSIMYANNEIGTVQPIAEISAIIRNFRETRNKRQATSETRFKNTMFHVPCLFPLFHTDAVQAFQFLDCDVNRLGVDMMTLSGHKIYGPKGAGCLYVRNVIDVLNVVNDGNGKKDNYNKRAPASDKTIRTLKPVITGGSQEFGLRSGTENIPLIVGFAKAVELAAANRRQEFQRIQKLKDYFRRGLLKAHPGVEINGPKQTYYKDARGAEPVCLPGILNVYFPDYEAHYLLTKFDLAGIAVSAGSACSARSAEPSYVVEALGYGVERAKRSIRFSFGAPTTRRDIDSALRIIRKLL